MSSHIDIPNQIDVNMSDHSFENTYEVISDSIPFIYSFFTNSLESSESFRTILVNILDYIYDRKKREYDEEKKYDRNVDGDNNDIKSRTKKIIPHSCSCFLLNILMMVILLLFSSLKNRLKRPSLIAE